MVFLDLILNLTLLVSLSLVSGFIDKRWPRRTGLNVLLNGLLFGGAAIIGMLKPLVLSQGLIFDGRSIMISLCAFYFGPFAGTVAALMTITCRITLGGMGAFSGVLVILSSTLVGLAARYRLNPDKTPPTPTQLYIFGILVHLAMLAMLLTLPGKAGFDVVKQLGLYIIFLYPLATILAGKILSDQITASKTISDLQQTTQNLLVTLQSIGDAVITSDLENRIVFINPIAEKLTGWNKEEAIGKPVEDVFRLINEVTREKAENPVKKVIEYGEIVALANHTLLVDKQGNALPIADSAAPIRNLNGKITGVILVFRDQNDERRVEKLLKARLSLVDFAATHNLQELLTKSLDEVGELVGSPIGFYHFVEKDQKTLTLQQWSTRTLKEFCHTEGHGMHYGIDKAGVWVDCVHQKKPVVHNDYESLAHKKGLPEGHAKVVRELVVPIMRGDKVVAILGVGNKKDNYTDKDVETVSYLADVTWQLIDKKRTDEALMESESLFRNIFEHHAAVKLILDPDSGDIIDANKAAEAYYGWSIDRLKQMNIKDINTLPPDLIKNEIEKARTLKRVEFEFRHRRADGSIRDVAVFSSKLTIKGKDLLHSIIHDITDRKQMEKDLKESEAKYRNLFENAPIGIFTTHSNGKALSINRTMATILGFNSPEEAMEHYTSLQGKLYVDPGQRDLFVKQLKEKGHVENFEYQARKADGKIAWLRMNARLANYEEDNSFIIEGFTTDITDQIKLEEQFRQAMKMESVGRLAGGVAHDYNNMISVIIGNTELAMDRVNPSDPLYENLQEIYNAARRSADVTRQLLAFARKQTIAPKVIDLNNVVEGSLKMLKRLIGEDIDLSYLPGNVKWPVNMDPSQIDQILANLTVNARDAIAGVGKITIETGMTTFDQSYCDDHNGFIVGDYVQLTVSDDGLGMDKLTLENLFEPFFTTKDIGKGTGLGLATVYGIVKQNNGFINVYSEPDQGTMFNIYFPRHMSAPIESCKFHSDFIPTGHGETILLVEDEPSILNMGSKILEKLGYSVFKANTTIDAIQIAENHASEINLLITDVVMPEMNGKDLAELLIRINPKIKLLFMSGYTANVIAGHGVLEEGVCFIQKPFSRKDFAIKVREALDMN